MQNKKLKGALRKSKQKTLRTKRVSWYFTRARIRSHWKLILQKPFRDKKSLVKFLECTDVFLQLRYFTKQKKLQINTGGKGQSTR